MKSLNLRNLFKSLAGILVLGSFQLILFNNCGSPAPLSDATQDQKRNIKEMCLGRLGVNSEWSGETEVAIDNYSANAMEPKVSADGVVLFWNDKPASDTQMDIHYAVKQSNGRYLHIGTLPGTVDSSNLDGTPAIDSLGNFYFISTRAYASTQRTLFGGLIQVLGPNSLSVANVQSAEQALTPVGAGHLYSDVEVSWDGKYLAATDSVFSGKAFPDSSKLVLFNVNSRSASVYTDSDRILANVNNGNCLTYAATFSPDMLELYYTVYPASGEVQTSDFRIVVSKRASLNDAFGTGAIISAVTGTSTEGPALSYGDGGKTLYYHKMDSVSGRFKIYKLSR